MIKNNVGSAGAKVVVVGIVILLFLFFLIWILSFASTQSYWDAIEVERYKPLITNINETYPEDCYSRITVNSEYTMITYFYYWSYQDFGVFSHEDDWEPIFVFVKNNEVDRVAYDQWHYRVGRDTDPACPNNHVLIEFIDDYRAISTVAIDGNYTQGLNYSITYLDDNVRERLIDFGFKQEILDNPAVLWDTWLFTNQYKINDMWDRKEKYKPD